MTPRDPVRRWSVGGGLVVVGGEVLLVRNRRRDGRLDWSPPGGVIDPGETLLAGLTREVREETGIEVRRWDGPAYRVEADAPDMGWSLVVEAHVAVEHGGHLHVEDPDGIVEVAAFVTPAVAAERLAAAPRWVREPLVDWLTAPPAVTPTYAYRIDGTLAAGDLRVHRLD